MNYSLQMHKVKLLCDALVANRLSVKLKFSGNGNLGGK